MVSQLPTPNSESAVPFGIILMVDGDACMREKVTVDLVDSTVHFITICTVDCKAVVCTFYSGCSILVDAKRQCPRRESGSSNCKLAEGPRRRDLTSVTSVRREAEV